MNPNPAPNPAGSANDLIGSADDLDGSADDEVESSIQFSDTPFPSDESTNSMKLFRNMTPMEMMKYGWTIPPGMTPKAVNNSSDEESYTPTSEVPTDISTSPLQRSASEPMKPTQVASVRNDLVHSDP